MIYKFLHDGAGRVIAEAKRSDLVSFLDLHYPASDIPQQARALYLKSWIRLIADVGSEPQSIVPERDASTTEGEELSSARAEVVLDAIQRSGARMSYIGLGAPVTAGNKPAYSADRPDASNRSNPANGTPCSAPGQRIPAAAAAGAAGVRHSRDDEVVCRRACESVHGDLQDRCGR